MQDLRLLRLTSKPENVDTNTRIVLYARIDVPKVGPINFLVTHFSYFDLVQCRNAAELLHFISLQNDSLPTSKNVSLLLSRISTTVCSSCWRFQHIHYFWRSNCCNSVKNFLERKLHTLFLFKIFRGEQLPDQSRCQALQSQYKGAPSFKDVWLELHPNEPGLSFSNMPWPGLQVC